MEIESLLGELEDLIEGGSMLPWFGRRYVREDEFHRLVNAIRHGLPKEISEAGEVTMQRDRILRQAHDQAREILDQANRQALGQLEEARLQCEALVAQENVVRQAQRTAEATVRQADQDAVAVRADTERWLQSLFTRLEHEVVRVNQAIAEARHATQVQATRSAPVAPPPEGAAPAEGSGA